MGRVFRIECYENSEGGMNYYQHGDGYDSVEDAVAEIRAIHLADADTDWERWAKRNFDWIITTEVTAEDLA